MVDKDSIRKLKKLLLVDASDSVPGQENLRMRRLVNVTKAGMHDLNADLADIILERDANRDDSLSRKMLKTHQGAVMATSSQLVFAEKAKQ